MSDDMVERVARAILFRGGDDGSDESNKMWKHCNEGRRTVAYEQARAAIEAMREPTPQMVDAGVTADTGKTLGERVASCHRSMIDAALQRIGD